MSTIAPTTHNITLSARTQGNLALLREEFPSWSFTLIGLTYSACRCVAQCPLASKITIADTKVLNLILAIHTCESLIRQPATITLSQD